MRIAYVISRYPAVSHTFVLREVRALRALGLEVHTFSVRRSREALSEADREEAAWTQAILPPGRPFAAAHGRALAHHPLAYAKTLAGALARHDGTLRGLLWAFFYFLEAIVLWDACRRRGIRHIHAHFANVASDLALLTVRFARHAEGRRGGWTWSFTMHGPTEFYEVARHRLAEKTREAALVVCISDFCRSQLMALVAAREWEKLHVVHCGVDVDALRRVAASPRRRVERVLEILCVGRLVPVKGQRLLLEAAEQLRRHGNDAHVTFVGDGPERTALERFTLDRGLADAVTFAGAVGQDRIGAYFAAADVFCLPSFAEGVPVVLMEAMACGLPVVTTRIMGIPELVDHGRHGLLVPPGRVDALVDALETLAASPTLRQQMGEAGRTKVAADFDGPHSARQLAALFAALLREEAPTAMPDIPATIPTHVEVAP